MSIVDKRLLIGICGGIAAYKSAELVRLLVQAGAAVKVVMTPAATQFITPLTLQALSGEPVEIDLFNRDSAMAHIDLARWADFCLIAPITANRMAHIANGFAIDLIDTICLATQAPIAVAPAMNRVMWANRATQQNLKTLENNGIQCWGPEAGSQACGDVGEGRMLEPQDLYERVEDHFTARILSGKKVLITAGPTQEAIDPVRFISNHSSGKMGYALASAAVAAGADVHMISGPVTLKPAKGVQVTSVVSAHEMLTAVLQTVTETDILIGCAAVSDYRPSVVSTHKVKKTAKHNQLELEPTEDILASLIGHSQQPFKVGFAAETQHLEQYANAKRIKKQLDLIVANLVGGKDSGFNSDQNAAVVLGEDFRQVLAIQSKLDLAKAIIHIIANRMGLK